MIQKVIFNIPFVKKRNIGILLLILFSFLSACDIEKITPGDPRFNIIEEDAEINEETENNENTENVNQSAGNIYTVYFAQTHVFEPNYMVPNTTDVFKLISNRDALI